MANNYDRMECYLQYIFFARAVIKTLAMTSPHPIQPVQLEKVRCRRRLVKLPVSSSSRFFDLDLCVCDATSPTVAVSCPSGVGRNSGIAFAVSPNSIYLFFQKKREKIE